MVSKLTGHFQFISSHGRLLFTKVLLTLKHNSKPNPYHILIKVLF